MQLQGFHKPPENPNAWFAYKTKTRMEKWAVPALWTLLLLDIFETPLWCGNRPFHGQRGCAAATSSEYILSNVPVVPISAAVALELFIFLILIIHFASHVRLYYAMKGHGHATTGGALVLEGCLLMLSVT
ncbi:unnamed protein product, partial [Effrenium voratum]